VSPDEMDDVVLTLGPMDGRRIKLSKSIVRYIIPTSFRGNIEYFRTDRKDDEGNIVFQLGVTLGTEEDTSPGG
jgi:hypothetical protein